MAPTHGIPSTYNNPYKCRCVPCKLAHRQRMKESKAARVQRGRENPKLIPHGTAGGRTNWDCPCGPCTVAHNAQLKKYREKKKNDSVEVRE